MFQFFLKVVEDKGERGNNISIFLNEKTKFYNCFIPVNYPIYTRKIHAF